tara:strand:+ start:1717 stop:2850 length:1134 start_codon:yes stop_codon:yes gene_type:complete
MATDYLSAIGAYGSSQGGSSQPDLIADITGDTTMNLSSELLNWFNNDYSFDRNGAAASAVLVVPDGDAVCTVAEKDTIVIEDGFGVEKTYVIVDDTTTTVATGAVLSSGSDTGSGTAGTLAGGIAVAVNVTGSVSTQGALLTQLKAAIEDADGHDTNITATVSGTGDGLQTLTLTHAAAGDQGNGTTLRNGLTGVTVRHGFKGGTGRAATATVTVTGNVTAGQTLTITGEDATDSASDYGRTKAFPAKDGSEDLSANPPEFHGNAGDNTVIATSIKACIRDNSGLLNDIVVSQNGAVLTLMGKRAGALPNVVVAADQPVAPASGITVTNFSGGRYGFTGIGAVLPADPLMTFTNASNFAVLKTALSSTFKSFCKIKK